MMQGLVPREISAVLPESYAVGGAVRDLLLGRQPKDVDLCTPATPEEVTRLFTQAGYRVIPTGEKHGTVTVLVGGVPYEITTFRTDVETDGRHAVVEYTRDIREDLARRDLTINAMAIDGSGRVVDPFDGREDLRRRIVRSVGDPYQRFAEDMLRIIRAARFASTLGFRIDPTTAEAMSAMAPILLDRIGKQDTQEYRLPNGETRPLVGVSVERLNDEFDKAFAGSERPSTFLSTMWDLGVLQTLVPEMANADDLLQDPKWHPEGSVWKHTLEVVDRAPPGLRWNALFHDLGKCLTAEDTGEGFNRFHGHEGAGADVIADIGRRLKMSADEVDSIEATTRMHMNPTNLPEGGVTERVIRRFQHSAGPHLGNLEGIVRADAGPRYRSWWDPLFVPVQASTIQPALMGRHLLEHGFKPGPDMGAILKRAFEHQLDSGETDVERLIQVATGGQEPTVATVAIGMVRMAAAMDARGVHDLADRMDRMAQRQMMLPLEMDGGEYTDIASDVIPRDEFGEREDVDDLGLYHVTPYYPSVLQHGLQSKLQLSNRGIHTRGLGGETTAGPYSMEDPGMVATTYSRDRAEMLEADLQQLGGWLRGEVSTASMISPILDAADSEMSYDGPELEDFYRDVLGVLDSNGVDVSDISIDEDSEWPTAEELGRRIDAAPIDMEARYEIVRDLGGQLGTHIQDYYRDTDNEPPLPISGLAAPYDAIKGIRPEDVRTIPLRVRRDAPIQHIPGEEQVNFFPWDLSLDAPELMPHERQIIQRTMVPAGMKGRETR